MMIERWKIERKEQVDETKKEIKIDKVTENVCFSEAARHYEYLCSVTSTPSVYTVPRMD